MAHDVAMFLTWAAEPTLEARKQTGLKVMLFLIVLTGAAVRDQAQDLGRRSTEPAGSAASSDPSPRERGQRWPAHAAPAAWEGADRGLPLSLPLEGSLRTTSPPSARLSTW